MIGARWRIARRGAGRAMLLMMTLAATLPAQRAIDWSTRPVLLLTMGQGDEVFEKFGHNAVVVWDEAAGRPLVYNWGMFDFQQPNFIGRFLSGDTKYWMEPWTLDQTLAQYRQLDRTVTAQELQLTPGQKSRLVTMLATTALEENKFYRYDYYRDNCSTRARDAIDAVTDGALRRAMTSRPGDGSYRWHTRRLLAYSAPLYLGAEMVLGVDADAPISAWQEAFLPQSLAASMQGITLPAADGVPARPLALPVDTLFRAERAPEPRAVSYRYVLCLSVGLVLAAVLLGAGRAGPVGACMAIAGWSLLSAILGTLLCLAWFATRHVFMANNPTVALLNPGWLLGVYAGVMVLRGGVSRQVMTALAVMLGVGGIGTAGAALFGSAGSAFEMAALVLPSHAAVVWLSARNPRRATMPASVGRRVVTSDVSG